MAFSIYESTRTGTVLLYSGKWEQITGVLFTPPASLRSVPRTEGRQHKKDDVIAPLAKFARTIDKTLFADSILFSRFVLLLFTAGLISSLMLDFS